MPRDGSNVYSPPAGTLATTLTAIESAPYNAFVQDLTLLANEARPISAGGTGANNAAAARTELGVPASAQASTVSGAWTVSAGWTVSGNWNISGNWTFSAPIVVETSAAGDLLTLSSKVGNANDPQLVFRKSRGGNGPASQIVAGDDLGNIVFQGFNATGYVEAASIRADSTTNTGNLAAEMIYSAATHRFVGDVNWTAVTNNNAVGGVPVLVNVGGNPGLPAINGSQLIGVARSWTEIGPTATTSGTAFNVTSIPSSITELELTFFNISLSGSDHLLMQIGAGGSPTTTGYTSSSSAVSTGGTAVISATNGVAVYSASSANTISGTLRFQKVPGVNSWVSSHVVSAGATLSVFGGGSVTISGVLDNLRLTRTGSDTFDGGSFFVRYR